MSRKTAKTIAGIVCLLLAAGSGYFALILWGLARMDTGIVTWTPQLVFAFAAPVLLLAVAVRLFVRRP